MADAEKPEEKLHDLYKREGGREEYIEYIEYIKYISELGWGNEK